MSLVTSHNNNKHLLGGSDAVDSGPGDSAHARYHFPWASPSVLSDLYFHRNPEEIEEYTAAKKAVNQEEFHGERTSLAPEFTATKLEVAAVSAGRQVPSVPASGSLPKTGASSPRPPLKTGLQPPSAHATEWTVTEWS